MLHHQFGQDRSPLRSGHPGSLVFWKSLAFSANLSEGTSVSSIAAQLLFLNLCQVR